MRQQVDIFIFVNPKSGSRQGQKLLEMGFQKTEFEVDTQLDIPEFELKNNTSHNTSGGKS